MSGLRAEAACQGAELAVSVTLADGRPLDEKELRQSLAEARAMGYSITSRQRTTEGLGIAAPFFDASGRVVGNVTVTVPIFRYRPEDEAVFASALKDMAAKVSAAMGASTEK